MLNDEEVSVLVSGLNEVMTFPVKHLKAVRPKNANQRVKVIQGDLKGNFGTFLSLQKSTAAVKLDNEKVIKSIDVTYLAAVSPEETETSNTSGGVIFDAGPFCVLAVSTLETGCTLTT